MAAKRYDAAVVNRDTNKGENRGVLTDREDALDDEVVELLERGLVGLGERARELFGGVRLGGLERLAGEGETAEEPHEALSRGALLLALLVLDELLERRRLVRRRLVASSDFLWIEMAVRMRSSGPRLRSGVSQRCCPSDRSGRGRKQPIRVGLDVV